MSSGTNIPKAVVITGPTGTGKTRLSIELAESLGGEIVSADSMQLYRGMDIGTAKVRREEMRGIRHHMIDAAPPGEQYSVARYVAEASACVDDILARGKLPFIVGGTNLYIDSLVSGRDFAENDSDGLVRARLDEEYERTGGEAMLKRLAGFDPERAEKLHAGDKRRIVRAIEIYELTGKTISEHDRETRLIPPRYDAAVIALDYADRAELYARINARVDEMVGEGLFAEVEALLPELEKNRTAMQAIGYKEVVRHLRGELDRQSCIELIKQESRRYAKRQLTWLRRDPKVFWIRWQAAPDFNEARRISTEYLHSRGI